jgi:light-regulated signal transduction histidine kinase (bacteriophytochrome)
LGPLRNSQEVLAVLAYLRLKRFTSLQVTQEISADYPDIRYPSGFETIAGFLSVPLSRQGRDFIAFFRKGQLQQIHWASHKIFTSRHMAQSDTSCLGWKPLSKAYKRYIIPSRRYKKKLL